MNGLNNERIVVLPIAMPEMCKGCLFETGLTSSPLCFITKKATRLFGNEAGEKRAEHCPLFLSQINEDGSVQRTEAETDHGPLKDTDIIIDKLTKMLFDSQLWHMGQDLVLEKVMDLIDEEPTVVEPTE